MATIGGLPTFDFTLQAPAVAEGFGHKTEILTAEGGREVGIARWPADGRFRTARATIKCSSGDNSLATFKAFFLARQGQFGTFLYKPLAEADGKSTAEALGTGDASETDFYLDYKYVYSADMVVMLNGTPQSSGWTLQDNGTAPYVQFSSPPGAGVAVTATYWFYIPCRFEQDELPGEFKVVGSTDADSVVYVPGMSWHQDRPSSHEV